LIESIATDERIIISGHLINMWLILHSLRSGCESQGGQSLIEVHSSW
jgi:hypothetical protein